MWQCWQLFNVRAWGLALLGENSSLTLFRVELWESIEVSCEAVKGFRSRLNKDFISKRCVDVYSRKWASLALINIKRPLMFSTYTLLQLLFAHELISVQLCETTNILDLKTVNLHLTDIDITQLNYYHHDAPVLWPQLNYLFTGRTRSESRPERLRPSSWDHKAAAGRSRVNSSHSSAPSPRLRRITSAILLTM